MELDSFSVASTLSATAIPERRRERICRTRGSTPRYCAFRSKSSELLLVLLPCSSTGIVPGQDLDRLEQELWQVEWLHALSEFALDDEPRMVGDDIVYGIIVSCLLPRHHCLPTDLMASSSCCDLLQHLRS